MKIKTLLKSQLIATICLLMSFDVTCGNKAFDYTFTGNLLQSHNNVNSFTFQTNDLLWNFENEGNDYERYYFSYDNNKGQSFICSSTNNVDFNISTGRLHLFLK